ncbi:tubulin binding cofactor E [Heterostelium album PN500]|uniref:Tubulin binding cofactor E n=1 Tax=Heterostelium pallidum (strain ATCC 26659 / Pp 5 / PN500) TaxID=670386 RepID=D3BL46_HETP5|nr:tubulin binding cofactor E [Heterostelium album PN500]EFA77780.1 tubulin binding cofactor E [Heterostelium album PN500]|eukprot:XP_020429908.1 tubulin binding cofactor E [Heterostelium album PN500]
MHYLNYRRMDQIKVGDRILSDDGYHGTVMYIGDVDGFQGMWYGLCWDDPTRGKHRGTIKDRTYFQCPYHNSSASFMKIDKLTRGIYFMDAIINKYTEKLDNYVQVEMIGMEKIRERQRHISTLENINATSLKIANINDDPIIFTYLSENLKELNLTNNLLSNWNDIIKLLKQLRNLENLTLSENRLEFNHKDIVESVSVDNKFKTITTLLINRTNINWSTAVSLVSLLFPSLTTLGLHSNYITDLTYNNNNNNNSSTDENNNNNNNDLQNIFKNLLNLDLSNNLLSNTNDLIELSKIESLIQLNLNDNKFKSIEIPEELTSVSYDQCYAKDIVYLREENEDH